MERELKNKVAVVTGGARGIGYQIASKYIEKGIKLAILLDINESLGQEAAKTLNAKHGHKAVFFKCDVSTDLEDITKKIFGTYGQVDILVNCAGVADENSVKRCLGINSTALMEWSLKFHEHMSKNLGGKGGTIVNLASIYGFQITPYFAIYHASKHAVMAFTRSLGHELNFSKYGVRVVAICPGFTKTDFFANVENWRFMDSTNCFVKAQEFQEVEAVGQAAVDVFEQADSGTAWEVSGGRKIIPVGTEIVIKH